MSWWEIAVVSAAVWLALVVLSLLLFSMTDDAYDRALRDELRERRADRDRIDVEPEDEHGELVTLDVERERRPRSAARATRARADDERRESK